MLPRFVMLFLGSFFCVFTWANPKPSIPVIYTTLKKEIFTDSLEALGTLKANEAIVLSSTVTDIVREVHFEDGQRVKAGDVLVVMADTEEHALVQETRSALAEAERQYARVKSLAKTQLATESLLDERHQVYESAKAKVLAAESRLKDRVLTAPFDGVVGLRNISVGTLVTPGTVITTLDDDRVMKLDITLPALYLEAVRPGLSITAKTRERSGEFHGVVTAVDSRIDPITRSITVRALLDNPEQLLRPGMLMTIELQKSETLSLLLPEEALLQEGFRNFVFKINPTSEPKSVTRHEVRTGVRKRGYVVITEGLNEGDQVVTHGILRLRDGSAITLINEQKGEENLSELLSKAQASVGISR